MKKAFTIFEFILTLILFSIISALIYKPLLNINNNYFIVSNNDSFNLNSAVIILDKLIGNSIYINDNFDFLLIDYENIIAKDKNNKNYVQIYPYIYKIDNKYKLLNSNSNMLYENYKFLNKKYFYVYSLDFKKVFKIDIKNNNEIYFYDNKFEGSFLPIFAKINIFVKNKDLYLRYCYDIYENCKDGLLLNNIDKFKMQKIDNYILIDLCKKSYCIKKSIAI